ncbi:hypothetical protein BX070DRAFT_184602, partial [Coemansia spiralis]
AKEVDQLLQHESMQLYCKQEVERVLAQSPLDPFAILGVQRTCSENDIKLAYRSKSRLIHPDKTVHDRAREAFEKLKKAETELMDESKRKTILAMMQEARRELAAEWRAEVQSGKRREEDAGQTTQAFEDAALAKYRSIMIDIEWRRRQKLKQEMAAEGAARIKEEEQAKERRKKRDADKAWEDSRDERVSNWRSFQAAGAKGSKSK